MPRAKAPVVGVISYFQTAPLEQAQLTLAIVKHVVAAREEEVAPVEKRKVKPGSATVARKERADKGKVRKAKDEGLGDLALPGMKDAKEKAAADSTKVGSFAV